MKTFKTKKGTELPLLNLKGKDYLQVAHRLVWLREEHPDWTIKTEIVEHGEDYAIFRATILEGEHVYATAHKRETKQDFADYIEKCETSAIGRALAHCGYGTQFAPELDEGERLADSPINRIKSAAPRPVNSQNMPIPKAGEDPELSEAQIKRLFAIAHKNHWSNEDVRHYIGQLGLESTKELKYFQYVDLVNKIELYPKEKG